MSEGRHASHPRRGFPDRRLPRAPSLLLMACLAWVGSAPAAAEQERIVRAMTEAPAFSAEVSAMLEPFSWQADKAPERFGRLELALLREQLRPALAEQPRLLVQLSREQEAGFRIDEARAERRPQLQLGLEHRSSLREVDRNAFDRGTRVDAIASVSQLLFDFGASGQRVRSAELGAEAERWQSRASTEQLLMDGLQTYYDVLRFRMQVALAEDNVERHQRILEDVQERRTAGAGSRADVLRAQSRIADARSRLVSLQGQLARARNAYIEIFAQAPGSDMALPRLPLRIAVEDVEAALSRAMRENSALKRSLTQTDASAAAARAERNSRWPRVSLSLQGRQFDVNDPSDRDTDMAVLVNVEYSPYTGGASSSRVDQADARLNQARHERAALQRELASQFRSALTDAEARESAWQAQTLAVEADREALEAYRAQFVLGRRGLTDMLDAQRDLFQSVLQLVDYRIDWDLARFNYLYVSGELLPTLELTAPARGTGQ